MAMYTKKKGAVKTLIGEMPSDNFNDELTSIERSLITEAVQHFRLKRSIKGCDERFFYQPESVQQVLARLDNPNIQVRLHYDDIDTDVVWCWEIYRVS